MSNAVSPVSGQEAEKSLSSPSDYELFDYEDDIGEQYPYQRMPPGAEGSFQDDDDDEENGLGTPLNLELAQLLNQGIVSKAKANFGISKNIETLEQSTIELSIAESTGSPKRRPKELAESGASCSSSYKRDPDLYLRRSDDDYSNYDDGDNEEDVDFVRVKRQNTANGVPNETVFENGSPDGVGGSSLKYTEPTTSFHSAYGYDNERMMFEGIP